MTGNHLLLSFFFRLSLGGDTILSVFFLRAVNVYALGGNPRIAHGGDGDEHLASEKGSQKAKKKGRYCIYIFRCMYVNWLITWYKNVVSRGSGEEGAAPKVLPTTTGWGCRADTDVLRKYSFDHLRALIRALHCLKKGEGSGSPLTRQDLWSRGS